MSLRELGAVGIMPAGALGVAFFYHLTAGGTSALNRVSFLEREGSKSGRDLRQTGILSLVISGESRQIDDARIWKPSLLQCVHEGWLPEMVLVCTQPDQLLSIVEEGVELLQRLFSAFGAEQAVEQWPAYILCSNGIYFQRVRQFLIEKLEEATLFGRLPDLWPALMPKIVGKVLRGVTIQTGQREGYGSDAVYRPGARGRTRLTGGNHQVRERCADVLTRMGGWFEVAEDSSPTRVEFDKALVNLTVNLLGQLCAIDDKGNFCPLTVGEILTGKNEEEAQELARRVIDVGKAVHAYQADEQFEIIWENITKSCHEYLEHVPSSLQWIELQLGRGVLEPRLTPTETWLLEPLKRYARAAGLEETERFFERLVHRVEGKLSKAVTMQKKKGGT